MKNILHSDYWVEIPAGEFLIGISRFQFSPTQVTAILNDNPVSEILGALEEPDIMKTLSGNLDYPGRTIAAGNHKNAEAVCKRLEVRLPSNLEWEKAARGTDGRLYPWGDEWDPGAGWFYRGRYRTYEEAKGKDRVDAYPRGVSPYGVYGMVGYLPQWVGTFPWPGARGTHPDETTAEMAWIDHMIPFAHKRGEHISLRPVLDKWPVQQWQGADFQKDNL